MSRKDPQSLTSSSHLGLAGRHWPRRMMARFIWQPALAGMAITGCALGDREGSNDDATLEQVVPFGATDSVGGATHRNEALVKSINAGGFPRFRGIRCSVFDDGSARETDKVDAVYLRGPYSACVPDGTPIGLCRKWFGNCQGDPSDWGVSVTFSIFDDGGTNKISGVSAAFVNENGQICTADGTDSGTCRKWFGEPVLMWSSDNQQPLSWNLFNDGYTDMTRTTAIYYRSPSQSCMPDGTPTGTCRKWFGRGKIN